MYFPNGQPSNMYPYGVGPSPRGFNLRIFHSMSFQDGCNIKVWPACDESVFSHTYTYIVQYIHI